MYGSDSCCGARTRTDQIANEVVFGGEAYNQGQVGVTESCSMMRLPGDVAHAAKESEQQIEGKVC